MRNSENNFQNFLKKINPYSLFLVDGVGALVSAIMLGGILVQLETIFGMPRRELYVLSLGACIFMCYSFFCYFKKPKNWKFFLRLIAITNLIYCALTLFLVFFYAAQLTTLGFSYFILEMGIIVILVTVELKTIAIHS